MPFITHDNNVATVPEERSEYPSGVLNYWKFDHKYYDPALATYVWPPVISGKYDGLSGGADVSGYGTLESIDAWEQRGHAGHRYIHCVGNQYFSVSGIPRPSGVMSGLTYEIMFKTPEVFDINSGPILLIAQHDDYLSARGDYQEMPWSYWYPRGGTRTTFVPISETDGYLSIEYGIAMFTVTASIQSDKWYTLAETVGTYGDGGSWIFLNGLSAAAGGARLENHTFFEGTQLKLELWSPINWQFSYVCMWDVKVYDFQTHARYVEPSGGG